MSSDWDVDAHDEDWEAGAWEDEDGDSLTVRCPACGADVYEDVEQCPACGEWIVHSRTATTSALADKPIWYVVLALLGIIAVVATLSGLAWM